jgi:hypothetical protein
MVMYTLIGRFAMGLFLPEDSTFFFMKAFVKLTDPIINRFYLMPWLLGYSVMGMLSFPLESELARGVANLVGFFVD